MSVQAIIESIKAEFEQAKVEYSARRARIIAASANQNEGVEPTIDSYGRLHAPCDGYDWQDDIYGAGEFLKIPELSQDECEYYDILYMPKDGFAERYSYKAKIKTTVSVVEQIKAELSKLPVAINVSAGASWGEGVCYMYVDAKSKRFIKAIESAASAIAPVEAKSNAVLSAGRQNIVATLKATFMKEDRYNPHLSDLVGIFERDDGATLFCNIGDSFKKLVESSIDELKGKRISFCAELIVNAKDQSKASCKRPTKVAIA